MIGDVAAPETERTHRRSRLQPIRSGSHPVGHGTARLPANLTTMTTPKIHDMPALRTDTDVLDRVTRLIGPAARDRQLWVTPRRRSADRGRTPVISPHDSPAATYPSAMMINQSIATSVLPLTVAPSATGGSWNRIRYQVTRPSTPTTAGSAGPKAYPGKVRAGREDTSGPGCSVVVIEGRPIGRWDYRR